MHDHSYVGLYQVGIFPKAETSAKQNTTKRLNHSRTI